LLVGSLALAAALAVVVVVRVAGDGAAPRSGLPSQARPGPVLLVPGYGGNTESLTTLANRIRAAGRAVTIVMLPGDGTGDLVAQAAALGDHVDGAFTRGAPSVDVVGYSAGGLVALLWAARDGGEHRARRVITLGSPMHGTTVASAGGALAPGACPTACRQLAPGSPLLGSLGEQPVPAGLPWLSLWTENDQTVTPPDSARLPGAVNVALQRICPDVTVSHAELPADPLVTAIVVRALGMDPLRAPTAEDCAALRAEGARLSS